MDMFVLIAAAAGTALGAGAVKLFGRNNRAGIPSLEVDIPYYRKELESGAEAFSKRLRQMFLLDDHISTWDEFAGSFPEIHRNELRKAIEAATKRADQTSLVMSLDEGKRHIECVVTSAHTQDGKLERVLVIFRDITALHKQQSRLVKETEQLKREVRQYSNILNIVSMPIWLRGEDLAIRYCNIAYSQAAEEEPERIAEQESLELYPQARALAVAAHSNNKAQTHRKHIIVGGARKLYEFTEIPLTKEHLMVGVAQDVTELETVQEELQRHIDAQSELLESVTSAMAVFGADQRLKFFNFAFVRLWGVDETWLNTQPTYGELLEVLREKRRLPEQANFPMFKQRHLKLFTEILESQEEIFYLPDGRTLRVLAIPHALGGILFAYEDVTDRLALERSYNTLIAVQRATLDNLHEGVIVFGEDGRIRLYNPRFLQLWKLEKSVLSQETHIADLVEKTRALHAFNGEWATYKQDFIASLLVREVRQKRLERADGAVIDSIVVPLPDGATLITFEDVTDSTLVERSLRERNDALQQADRLKTEFLANVSYELRSPLTSISGFSEMLAQNYFGELSNKQREYVGEIHRASQQLMHLINTILDIASIEAGYMRLDVAEVDIMSMAQSVVSLVQERMREHGLELTFNCGVNIGTMLVDEARVKQVFYNLLSNAIKYTTKGGKVTFVVEPVVLSNQELIMFQVQDTGVGISPEDHQAVFNKFYRSSSQGSAPKSGTGLGLSMVKSFIELHGGTVELSSTPGKGTVVTCYLPRHNTQLLGASRAA